jgi:PAS domain S-box-containing protein
MLGIPDGAQYWRSRRSKQPMTAWLPVALCVLAGSFAAATTARGSCLPLAAPELRGLDSRTEAQPDEAVREARARITVAAGPANAFVRAQLFAVLADAYTVQSRLDDAHAAMGSARAELTRLPPSAEVRRLGLRLDLLDNQLSIATSNSAAAVAATGKLLAGLPDDSVDRACTLSVRAIAYDYLRQPDLSVGDALIAYRIAQSGQWLNAKLEIAGTLARSFGGAGLYPQALQMMDTVVAIARTDKRTALLSTAEFERGTLLVKARRFAEARAALEQSKAYAAEIGDRFGIAAANANLCWSSVREGDLGSAERFCSGGDADLAASQREDLAIQLIGNRARLDLERHRTVAALQKLNQILTPRLHLLLPGSEAQFYWDRARAFRTLNRIPEANADLVRMHELEEAADSAQRNRQVAVLSALIASDEIAAANRQLQERVKSQQREAARQRELRITVSVATLVICALLGYLLWISERHRRALRRQESILRSAGQNAPDAFLLLDEQRRVQFANRNLCGQGPLPAIGEPVSASVPPSLLPTLTGAIDEAFERRTVVSFAATLPDQAGAMRQFEMCVVPAIERERVVGGTLRAIDVTEHQELERLVIDGASEERQRLSRELHEGVGQQFAGVLLLLGTASSSVRRGLPNSALLIEEIAQFVQDGIDAMRELARGLAPVKLGMGSLTVALQLLVANAARRLRIAVDCDCRLDGIVLSDLAADHLYGICREAVTNAALHGRCTRVMIVVRVAGDVLTVSISDDGQGMPPGREQISQGLGIKLMAYRTQLLGGRCRITAPPGGGTCVTATVPLDRVIAAGTQPATASAGSGDGRNRLDFDQRTFDG